MKDFNWKNSLEIHGDVNIVSTMNLLKFLLICQINLHHLRRQGGSRTTSLACFRKHILLQLL